MHSRPRDFAGWGPADALQFGPFDSGLLEGSPGVGHLGFATHENCDLARDDSFREDSEQDLRNSVDFSFGIVVAINLGRFAVEDRDGAADTEPEEGCKGDATADRLSETMEHRWASK